jgi:hypothetical protein
MTKREVIVSSVSFGPEGLDVQYMVLPEDVRSEGRVVFNRSASVSFEAPGTLGAAATDLRTSVEALVDLLLDQLDELPVFEPSSTEQLAFTPQDDDDDDVGMGDGR